MASDFWAVNEMYCPAVVAGGWGPASGFRAPLGIRGFQVQCLLSLRLNWMTLFRLRTKWNDTRIAENDKSTIIHHARHRHTEIAQKIDAATTQNVVSAGDCLCVCVCVCVGRLELGHRWKQKTAGLSIFVLPQPLSHCLRALSERCSCVVLEYTTFGQIERFGGPLNFRLCVHTLRLLFLLCARARVSVCVVFSLLLLDCHSHGVFVVLMVAIVAFCGL